MLLLGGIKKPHLVRNSNSSDDIQDWLRTFPRCNDMGHYDYASPILWQNWVDCSHLFDSGISDHVSDWIEALMSPFSALMMPFLICKWCKYLVQWVVERMD